MRWRRLLLIFAFSFGVIGLSAPVIEARPAKGQATANKKRKKKKKKKKNSHHHIRYKVAPGDTLGKIAEEHGVEVKHIVRWNKLKNEHSIRVGQTLSLYTRRAPRGGRQRRQITHKVKKGDTLIGIAQKHKVTVDKIKQWNPKIKRNPNNLKLGQKVAIWVTAPENTSTSIGHAARGRLVNGEPLPESNTYYIRNRHRVYGTNHTVTNLLEATRKVHKRFKKAPRLVVGDISFKDGGKMKPHKSHQSGRDVDIGYYPKGNEQLKQFVKMNKHNLDVEKTWFFVKTLIDSGQVEYVFIDRNIQKLLYNYALKNGTSKAYLEQHIQYPRPTGSTQAEVRHDRGHVNHMHIRFRCPSGDEKCR